MSPRIRRVAVIVGAVGVVAAAAGSGADPAAALAKALGLSEAKVRAAMQATMPSGGPQDPQSQPSQQQPSGQSAA
jgi:hypothetical protein